MYKTLFIHEVRRYWQLNKINVPLEVSKNACLKITQTMALLEQLAGQTNQPFQFYISAYAYFFSDVFKCKSFNLVQLRLSEFYERLQSNQLPIFTNDDVELAYKVRTVWNQMNSTTSSDIPFSIRKYLSKSRVTIGKNTFFERSNNFIYFTMIANFINQNKLNYPEMHGINEFFLHLPILNKPRKYLLAEYIRPAYTLEKYYKLVYKSTIPKEQRYTKFLISAKTGNADYFKSGLWCANQLVKDLERVNNVI